MREKVRISFWRVFWASLTAGIAIMILVFMFVSGIIGSLFQPPAPFYVKPNSVLHMKLDGNIKEKTSNKFEPSLMGVASTIGLSDILYGLEKAEKDDNVQGVFIELSNPACGFATSTAIRDAINKFEESGKFVVTYFQGEAISLKHYYIASAANESYAFPSSVMSFVGIGAELTFFKGMFDKIGLEMQVIRGSNNDFKSAVEPYFLEKMSDSSKLQLTRYLNNIWDKVISDVAEEKGLNINVLNGLANDLKIRRAKDAVTHGLIDAVKYRDEVLDLISLKLNLDDKQDIEFASFEKYAKKKFEDNQKINRNDNPNVAVIIAEGGVVKSGDGLSSNKITKLLKEAREKESIKSVVLRVNSPGGSALASDEIWREVKLTNEVKPVIVSMGDVAASGGYYIAAGASRIFAQENTITGSIGVFGVIPFTGNMLEDKLGLSFDRVQTNNHAVMSTNKRLDEVEMEAIQAEVDEIYEDFLEIVADGRKMSKASVNEIARGRVWTGKDALNIGLVDEIGGLNEAVNYAAQLVNITDIKVEFMPKVKKEPWVEILEMINEEDEKGSVPDALLELLFQLKKVENLHGVQARLPYFINL